MQSDAKTVEAYIQSLPPERREAIEAVRKVILTNLPEGYREVMDWGMITYEVPLEIYPDTYNKKPLAYVALASQKQHMAVYLTSIYADKKKRDAFEKAYRATGKRFDVGKSCVRFRTLDDLPLDLIGQAVRAMPMNEYIALAKRVLEDRKQGKTAQ